MVSVLAVVCVSKGGRGRVCVRVVGSVAVVVAAVVVLRVWMWVHVCVWVLEVRWWRCATLSVVVVVWVQMGRPVV